MKNLYKNLILSTFLSTSFLLNAKAGPISGNNGNYLTIQPSGTSNSVSLSTLLTDGVFYDIRYFGAALNGCTSGTPTDDSAAVVKAVAKVNADWNNNKQIDTVYIPPGCLYTSTGFTFGYKVPAHVLGAGADVSKIVWATAAQTGTNFSGDTISFSGAFGGNSINSTLTNISNLNSYNSGASVLELTIVGNTTLTGNGIMFYDSDNHIYVHHVIEDYISGCGICGGLYNNTNNGLISEGYITDNRLEVVGGNTLSITGLPAPAIGIFTTCNGTAACATGSASNALTVDENRIYGFSNDGIQICNQNNNQGDHKIFINANQIEGKGTGSSGDNIHLGNTLCGGLAYYDYHIDNNTLDVVGPNHSGIHFDGNSAYSTLSNAPYAVDVRGLIVEKGGISNGNGIQLDYAGRDIYIETNFINVGGNQLVCNSGVQGTIQINAGADFSSWTTSSSCGTNNLHFLGSAIGSFTSGDALITADAFGNAKDGGTFPSVSSGTYTPTITPNTVGNWSATYTTQYGNYLKVGSLTCVNINLVFSATQTTSSSTFLISLPFTVSANEQSTFGVSNFSAGISGVTTMAFIPQPGHAYAFLGLGKASLVFPSVYWSISTFATSTTYTLSGGGCYY